MVSVNNAAYEHLGKNRYTESSAQTSVRCSISSVDCSICLYGILFLSETVCACLQVSGVAFILIRLKT